MQLICNVCGVKSRKDKLRDNGTWVCPLCMTKQEIECTCDKCLARKEEFYDNIIEFEQDFNLEE